MKENVLAYLRERKEPVSAQELVSEVLRVRQAGAAVSRRLIESLLQSDPRFRSDEQGRWRLEAALGESPGLQEGLMDTRWTIVHLGIIPDTFGGGISAIAAERVHDLKIEARMLLWTVEGYRQATSELGMGWEEVDAPTSNRESLDRLGRFLEGTVWVSFEPKRDLARLNAHRTAEGLLAMEPLALGLRTLTRKLFPGEPVRSLEDAAGTLGVRWADATAPDMQGRLATEVFLRLLDLVEEVKITRSGDLLAFQNREPEVIRWDRFRFDNESLATIPKQPGIYFFTDRAGTVIYVGKAKNLNSRVQSYFQATGAEEEKKQALRESAYDLTYEITGSELEALLREADAIKTLRPLINTQMEIHETAIESERLGNRILILPSRAASHIELFLVRQDKAVEQIQIAQSVPSLRAVERRIRQFFFAKKKTAPAEESWKASLIWRWLRRNRNHILTVDPDQMGDWSECVRLLRRYIQEPLGLERVIHR